MAFWKVVARVDALDLMLVVLRVFLTVVGNDDGCSEGKVVGCTDGYDVGCLVG